MRQRRIASAKDRVGTKLGAELIAERLVDIDSCQYAEAFSLQRFRDDIDRFITRCADQNLKTQIFTHRYSSKIKAAAILPRIWAIVTKPTAIITAMTIKKPCEAVATRLLRALETTDYSLPVDIILGTVSPIIWWLWVDLNRILRKHNEKDSARSREAVSEDLK